MVFRTLRKFSLILLTSLTMVFSQSSFAIDEDGSSSFPSTGKILAVGLVGAAGLGTALLLSGHHGKNNSSPTPSGTGVLAWVTIPPINTPMAIDTVQVLRYEITNTGTGAVSLVISNFIPPITRRQDDVVNNCSGTLNPNQTCAIELLIAPTELGHFSQLFAITDANGPSNLTNLIQFDVIKNPTNPPLMITSPGYNNNMYINETQSLDYTVTNQGDVDVGVTAAIQDLVSQGSGVTISKNTCSPTLAKRATCYITVFVDPGSVDGIIEKNLNITDDLGAGHTYPNPINIFVSALTYNFNLSDNKFYSFGFGPETGNIFVFNSSPTESIDKNFLHISVNPPHASSNGITFGINTDPTASSCFNLNTLLGPGETCNYQYTASFTGNSTRFGLGGLFQLDEVIAVVAYDQPGLTQPIQLSDFVIDFYIPNHFWFLTLPPNTNGYKKLPVDEIFSVTAAPYDQNTVYVGTTQGLAFTDDLNNGTSSSWKTINTSNGLPNNYVHKVFVAKANSNNIFAGTENGLSISTNAGTFWQNFASGKNIDAIYANGKNVFINDKITGGLYFDTNLGADGFTKDPQFGNSQITAIVGIDNKIYVGVDSLDSTTGLWVKDFSNPSSTWTHLWTTSSIKDVFVSGENVYIITALPIPELHFSTNGGTTFEAGDKYTGTAHLLKVFANGTDVYVMSNTGLFHTGNIGDSTPDYNDVFTGAAMSNFWIAGNNALIATPNGLVDVANIIGARTTITASGNLPSNEVNRVFAQNISEANGTNIYAATSQGVSQSKDGAGSMWSLLYAHPANDVARLNNFILIAPENATPKYYDLNTESLSTFAGSLTAPIHRVSVAESGNFVFVSGETIPNKPPLATCGNTLICTNYPDFFKNIIITDIASNKNTSDNFDYLYIATNNGLYVDSSKNGFAFTTGPSQTPKLSGSIAAVFANRDSVYAFKTNDNKLYRSNNFGSSFTDTGITETHGVNQISVDNSGAIYLATTIGLRVIVTGSSDTYYSISNAGMADNFINGVFLLGNQIFAATKNGLSTSVNSGVLNKTKNSSKKSHPWPSSR